MKPLSNKLQAFAKKHASEIEACGRELATTFDIPSRDIISMRLGITPEEYRAIRAYQIAQEDRKSEREFVKAFTPNKHGEYA
ncbi:MAG TPA: hypothetical protein VN612_04630 [Acidobacteriaceae bacterium]|nr:hypothetical protein [Acidobacteriaceae bacterium]